MRTGLDGVDWVPIACRRKCSTRVIRRNGVTDMTRTGSSVNPLMSNTICIGTPSVLCCVLTTGTAARVAAVNKSAGAPDKPAAAAAQNRVRGISVPMRYSLPREPGHHLQVSRQPLCTAGYPSQSTFPVHPTAPRQAGSHSRLKPAAAPGLARLGWQFPESAAMPAVSATAGQGSRRLPRLGLRVPFK